MKIKVKAKRGMTLNWEKVPYSKLREYEDAYFYAFQRGRGIIYIGIAYHMDVVAEIKSNLRAFDMNTQGLSFWLGYIEKSDYQRITKLLIRDTENLLIFTHKPLYNTQCKNDYWGREDLYIKNKGCPHIKKRIDGN